MRTFRILAPLAAIFALGLSWTVVAQEADLSLETSATPSSTDSARIDFAGYQKAQISLLLPLGGTAEFSAQGYGKFAYDSTTYTAGSGLSSLTGYDLELFRLSVALRKPREDMSGFAFEIGRSRLVDPSRYVFSNTVDGASFTFNYPFSSIQVRMAYTGLQFRSTSTVLMSLADESRSSAAVDLFGSPRFLGLVNYRFPELFNHDVSFSAFVQEDMNPSSLFAKENGTTFESGKGGPLDTQYLTAKVAGAAGNLMYDAFFTYGAGRILSWLPVSASSTDFSYRFAPISSFLTGMSVGAPLPFDAAQAAFRLLYASGDPDASTPTEGNAAETYRRFTPVTTSSLGQVFTPNLSNIVFAELSLTAAPGLGSSPFSASLKLMTFFRPTSGAISAAGLKSGSTAPYLGTEADIAVTYGILSDVGLSCSVGAFIPGIEPMGAFDSGSSSAQLQFSARFTLTVNL